MSSALLLPQSAVLESRLVTGAAGTALRATAHVDGALPYPLIKRTGTPPWSSQIAARVR